VVQDRYGQCRHLLIADVAARVGVDHPVDLGRAERAPVSLGVDEVDDVERLDGHCGAPCSGVAALRQVQRPMSVVAAYSSSWRGPNASGSTSSMVLTPETVSSSMPGAECS